MCWSCYQYMGANFWIEPRSYWLELVWMLWAWEGPPTSRWIFPIRMTAKWPSKFTLGVQTRDVDLNVPPLPPLCHRIPLRTCGNCPHSDRVDRLNHNIRHQTENNPQKLTTLQMEFLFHVCMSACSVVCFPFPLTPPSLVGHSFARCGAT